MVGRGAKFTLNNKANCFQLRGKGEGEAGGGEGEREE